MGKAQDQLHTKIYVQQDAREQHSPENVTVLMNHHLQPPPLPDHKNYMRWLRIAVYSFLVLSTGAVATLLGRLYFVKGGSSKWMATLVQTCGFPILLPFLLYSLNKKPKTRENNCPNTPSLVTLASLYLGLGVFLAADCMLYSIGLLYLPVSTYSLICASQLAFNGLFSYLLNSEKFTPFIINSIVILTLSSTLLGFQNHSSGTNKVSKGKFLIGFLSTVGASALYSLLLSVTQLSFQKILNHQNFRVLNLIIYQSLVATIVILMGLFGSGEWKGLNKEMSDFELGKVSYLLTLVWTAISWQVYVIGAVGLIFEVSSLFSNVISTLSLPIVPVAAVIVFHDSMDGVKVVAILLAIWGFVSYVYQHHLDEFMESKSESDQYANGVSEVSLANRA